MERLGAVFDQYSNIILIAVAVCAGVLVPNGGSHIQPAIPLLVVFLVYSFLRGFRLRDVDVASEARIAVLSLGISYVLLPLSGSYVARVFLPETAVRGFVIVFAAPTTAVSAVWTRFSNGDVQLATTITVGSIVAAPIATPLLLIWLIGSEATIPVIGVLTDLLVVIGGGILLTALVPRSLLSERTVDTGAMGALMIILYASTAIVDIGTIDETELLAIGGVSTVLLGVGIGVSLWIERALGVDRTRTLPLFFTSSMKNLGIALVVSNLLQPDPLVVATIVTYFISQQIVGALVTDRVS